MTAPLMSIPHEDLVGGTVHPVLARPGAVHVQEDSSELLCLVESESGDRRCARVLDLTSIDLTLDEHAVPTEGRGPVKLELLIGQRPLWTGRGRPIPAERDRSRYELLDNHLDVAQILFLRRHLGGQFAAQTSAWAQQRDVIPAEFRAAVANLRLLLEQARRTTQDAEADMARLDPLARQDQERTFVEVLANSWGPICLRQYRYLHEISSRLPANTRQNAIHYATTHLLELIRPCPHPRTRA